MIEFFDTRPDVNVQAAEYKRLLGYPRDRDLLDRAHELAEQARQWYDANGRPWVYTRQAQRLDITNGSICIDGVPFASKRLQRILVEAQAESVFLAAVSAGPELEEEAANLWREEKPDEYFFLEVYGSAVVEQLITMRGAQLCAWADERGLAVLPHYSPGYPDWDISQQPRLLELIRGGARQQKPGKLAILDSGMLCPKKSLLAVFGLTRHTDRVQRLAGLNPCESCSFLPCQYRRSPYQGAPLYPDIGPLTEARQALLNMFAGASPLDRSAKYTINTKALSRWAAERLTISDCPNGTIEAVFRYEGKTCSNLGRPILFYYHVTLGPREQGYPIHEEWCGPAPGDQGHRAMCSFMDDTESLMAAVDVDKPLLGEPIDRVLSWPAPTSGAGCYCQPSDRIHKWRLVLETLHFALAQREAPIEQETACTNSATP
jgi:hypothetical protein